MQPLFKYDLCIRPFEDDDIPRFASAVRESVDTVGVWLPWCHAGYSEQDAQSWFDLCWNNIRCASAYDLGIFSADGQALYGGISINQINRQHNFGNVGYWVRTSSQRHGIASRAVQAIAEFGFTGLGLTRLEIVARPDNLASRSVAERSGASFECIARNRLFERGKPHPAALYSLAPPPIGTPIPGTSNP